MYRKIVIVNLKLLYLLSFDKLIVEAILINILNIIEIKSVIILFFEKRFVVIYINYVSNYLSKIEDKKITTYLISTLL